VVDLFLESFDYDNLHHANNCPKSIELANVSINETLILNELQHLIGNIPFITTQFEEIIIKDEKEFSLFIHDIMDGHYICVLDSTDTIKIVTEKKMAFVIVKECIDKRTYSLIYKVQKPRKLCINSKELYKEYDSVVNLYDISHVIKIFYGYDCNRFEDIVKVFTNAYSDNINVTMYNLFEIKNRINSILEKNRLLPLVNKEFKILEILASVEHKGMPFCKSTYIEYLNDLNNKNKTSLELFEMENGFPFLDTDSVYQLLFTQGKPLILYEDFLKKSSYNELLSHCVLNRLVNKYKFSSITYSENHLYPNYIAYDNYGMIQSDFTMDRLDYNYIRKKDKYFLMGSYSDMFFRIFASFGNIDYLLKPENAKHLVLSLCDRIYGKVPDSEKPLYEFYTNSFLMGFIRGYFDSEDMQRFFLNEYGFKIGMDELESLGKQFVTNAREVIDYILDFSRQARKESRFSHFSISNIYKFIKLTEADIFKQALLFIYDGLQNYNARNKYKVEIVGLVDGKFILIADEGSFNIAFDMLNRNLTKAYNKYIKNVHVLCSISTGKSILKG